MAEADIYLRPLYTSMVDIYKGFEPFVCCLKGMWVHPYTVTLAKLAPYLGSQGHLRNENDAYIHLRLLHTSILDIYKVFEALVCCLKGVWVHPYCYTGQWPQNWGLMVT